MSELNVFRSLEEVVASFESLGCSEILVKFLSANQDNEKNQIYLGKSLSLAQYLPGDIALRQESHSESKLHSKTGKPIVSLTIQLFWVWPNRKPSLAPNAKVIEYSQYPESRLTGFLSNCAEPPDALRRERQDAYGQRVLLLGVSGEAIYGSVVTEIESPDLVGRLSKFPDWELQPLLKYVPLSKTGFGIDSRQLISELKSISNTIHTPRKLKRVGEDPELIPVGGQAGGWTLEALLGIPMNAKSAPDKYGFEIKAVGGEKTSLITTEPDFGYRAESGVAAYLSKYGREGAAGGGKRVFSGIHKCNQVNLATGAMLTIQNWDFEHQLPNGEGQPDIALIHVASGDVISGWSFAKIGGSWTKKHAGAVYVETKRSGPSEKEGYLYGPRVLLGLGTSALRFLGEVASGQVALDPGDTQYPGKTPHARTQWRISGNIKTKLPARLSPLYENLSIENLFQKN